MSGVCQFIEGVPEYEVRDGIMHIDVDGQSYCMSLREFRLAMVRAQKALAEYDAREAEIVVLPDHAARS